MAWLEGTLLWSKLLRLLQIAVSSVLLISCVQLRRWPQSGCVNGGFKMSYRAKIELECPKWVFPSSCPLPSLSFVLKLQLWAGANTAGRSQPAGSSWGHSPHVQGHREWLGASKRQGTHDRTLNFLSICQVCVMYHVLDVAACTGDPAGG